MLNKRKFYINGQWVDPIKSNDCNVINPSTEENCAVISIGSKEDINLAVKSAKDAFNEWAFTSKGEKIKLLETLYSNYKKDGQILQMQLPWKWVPQKISQQNFKQELAQVI